MKATIFSAATMCALAIAWHTQAGVDPRSVTVDKQNPEVANPGGKAFFPIKVTRAGGGSLSIYLTVTGAPPDCTVSFYPPEVAFSDQDPSTKNAVLVIGLVPETRPGEYPITVSARHGQSRVVLACSSLLKVGSDALILQQPVLDIPVLQADGTIGLSGNGTPSQPVMVQATTNLALPNSWETIAVQMLDERGLFSLVDQDSTNYPARFYRLAQ